MKKRYFVNGVAALSTVLLAGVAGNAMATTDLNEGVAGVSYASENVQSIQFTDTIAVEAGAAAVVDDAPYVKFTCDGKWTTAGPSLSQQEAAAIGYSPEGNPLNDDTAVFAGLATGTTAKADTLTLSPAGLGGGYLTLVPGDTATCTYEYFLTANHWAQDNAAVTTTGPIAKFTNGLLAQAADDDCNSITGCTGSYATVDVTTGATLFTNDEDFGMVASVQLNARTDDNILDASGDPVTFAGMVDTDSADTNLVVSGDFTAATRVWIEDSSDCTGYSSSRAGVLAEDNMSVTFDNDALGSTGWGLASATGSYAGNGGAICVTVDGETIINTGDYTAIANLENTTDFSFDNNIDLGTVGTVGDNGSTDNLQLVLAPGGAYAGYVRISHISAATGEISLYVINDDGDIAYVTLEEIEGQETSTLAGMASTTQMSVDAIYAAAQLADETFEATGDGKLRITVKSTSPNQTVNASIYSLSKDGNSFVLLEG